jgi:hypothetical protein
MTARRDNPFELAAGALIIASGCKLRATRSGSSGIAYTRSDDWGIEAPRPRGPVSFAIFAHEVGHQLLHRNAKPPRWVREVEAWTFALACFPAFGLAGVDKAEARARRSVGYAFAKSIRRNRGVARKIADRFPLWWAAVDRDDLDLCTEAGS